MTMRFQTLMAGALLLGLFAGCSGDTETVQLLAPVKVSGVSPAQGAVTGGTPVTVYGSEFADGALVSFGGAYAANVAVLSDTELTCIAPSGSSTGVVDVKVERGGRDAGLLAGGFTYTAWWNGAWSRRKAVTVTGSTDGALADFQVKMTVDFDQDMAADWSDIRFTVESGGSETPLSFWRETADASQASFWVKIPAIPASPSTVTVNLYYGNPCADDASDFDTTFSKETSLTGALGIWHLDEAGGGVAVDASGNSNTGWLENFELPFGWLSDDGGAWGDVEQGFATGTSVLLDGEDDAVDFGGSSSLEARDAFTFATWVRPDTPSVSGRKQVIASRWAYASEGFSDTGRWQAFNAANAPLSSSGGFVGTAFDGRYMYYVPHLDNVSTHGQVLRFDTRGNFTSASSWEKFVPSTAAVSAWSTNAVMPSGKGRFASATVDGKIYVIGGWDGTNRLADVDGYDPAADTWTTGLAPLPAARESLAATVLDGKIYAAGGWDGTTHFDDVDVYDPATDTWTTGLADLPVPRQLLRMATVGGKIFAFNGDDGVGRVDVMEMYDPSTDTWTSRASVPQAAHSPSVAVWGGKIYVTGGYSTGYSTSNYAYDPGNDTWTTLAAYPIGIERHHAVAYEGYLHVFGGYSGSGIYRNEHYVYSIGRNTWEARESSPVNFTDHGVAIVDGKITIFGGGELSGPYIDNVYTLDPHRDWTGVTPTRFTGAAFDGRYVHFVPYYNPNYSYNGEVMRFDTTGAFTDMASWDVFDPGDAGVGTDPDGFRGGVFDGRYVYHVPYYDGVQSGEVMRFDTLGDFHDPSSWQTFDGVAQGVGTNPRGYQQGTFDGRYVYFCPYNNGTDYEAEMLRYDTTKDFEQAAAWQSFVLRPGTPTYWTTKANMPAGRYHHMCTVIDGAIFVFGGYNGSTQQSSAWRFDPGANSWTTLANLPLAVYDGGCAAAYGKAYVVGGYNGGVRDTVQEYDPKTDTWRYRAALPTARSANRCAAVDGIIYSVGGYYGGPTLPDVHAYDPVTNAWTARAPQIFSRRGGGCAAAEGHVVYVGGYDGAAYRVDVQSYDPTTNAWSARAPWPVSANGVEHCFATSAGNGIFVFGGYNSTGPSYYASARRFDEALNRWITFPDMATTRRAPVAAFVNEKAYVMGGLNPGVLNSVEELDPYDPGGFQGAVFDGRYVYYVPHHNSIEYYGTVTRYDTRRAFDDEGAWDHYTPHYGGVGESPMGFFYATFDGRYIYFSPYYNSSDHHGDMLRYDTTAPFKQASSWTGFDPGDAVFDGQGLDTDGYLGVGTDGRYVYWAPYANESGTYHATALRYDLAGGQAAWELAWSRSNTESEPMGMSATLITEHGHFTVFVRENLPAADWRHVTLTYDGAALSLYLDGTLKATTPATGEVRASTAPLLLGGAPEGRAFFSGRVDEARLYDRALSADEVEALAQRREYTANEPVVGTAGSEETR